MNDAPTQSVLSNLRRQVLSVWPVEKWKYAPTVVAVSGGPDSVATLRVLTELFADFAPNNKLVVAHVNHMTQQGHSQRHAVFVEQLAKQLELPCRIIQLTPPLPHQTVSEMSLRDLRYEQLTMVAAEYGARYIATGHTRDDQIETILFRILRGTGINGLSGIPRFRQISKDLTVVRPLLDVSRKSVCRLLEELAQESCTDATNSANEYSRNFLRNEVIPKINERFEPTFEKGILRLGRQAKENRQLLDELCAQFDSAINILTSEIRVDRNALVGQSPVLIRHWLVSTWEKMGWPLKDMTLSHWEQLSELALNPGTFRPVVFPGNVRVEIISNILVIGKQP